MTRAEQRRKRTRPVRTTREAWKRDGREPEPVDHEAALREQTPGPNAHGCSRTRPLYETEDQER